MAIIRSEAICLNCGEILVSRYNWDFKRCSCENGTFIDGGTTDYARIGGVDLRLVKWEHYTDDLDHVFVREIYEVYNSNSDSYDTLKNIQTEHLKELIESDVKNKKIYKKELKWRKFIEK